MNLKKLFTTLAESVKDGFKTLVAPIRSFFAKKNSHHTLMPQKGTVSPEEQARLDSLKEKKNGSRNIYLTDLDDTFINWRIADRSRSWKLKHRFLHRPANEPIELFDGAEKFIKDLNAKGVKTAIVSNKNHDKLIPQAEHHGWGKLFDKVIGHDRSHAINMRKPEASLPALAVEKLLGEKLYKGMEPVTVVFAGDRPNQDIASANALDALLKQYNPKSSCTSVLLNSRRFTDAQLQHLPQIQRPKEVARNYSDIQNVTERAFSPAAQKTIIPTPIPKEGFTAKEQGRREMPAAFSFPSTQNGNIALREETKRAQQGKNQIS